MNMSHPMSSLSPVLWCSSNVSTTVFLAIRQYKKHTEM